MNRCHKCLLIFLMTSSAYANGTSIDTSALNAHQFSMGWVGFVGHISEAEKKMNEIAREPTASEIFISIAQDVHRPLVARLYALCGLKKIGSPHYAHAAKRLGALSEKVSTMRADVMRLEEVEKIVLEIDKHRCN